MATWKPEPARRRRMWRRLARWNGRPERYLYARRRGMRRFAVAGLALAVVLCALAVFA